MFKKLASLLAIASIVFQPLALTKARAEQCHDWNDIAPIDSQISRIMGLYTGFNTNYLGQVQAYAGYQGTARTIEIRYNHTPTDGWSSTQLPSGNLVDVYTNVVAVSIYSNWYWPNTCNGYEYVSVQARIQAGVGASAVMAYVH